MEWIEFTYPFKVRFSDTDAYGVVHHSRYYCFFEEARFEFTNQCLKLFDAVPQGYDLKFPVISSGCEHRHALIYDLEEINIKLWFRILDGCKIEFRYEVKKAKENTVYAKGYTIHAILQNEKICLSVPEWITKQVRRSLDDAKCCDIFSKNE